jgi:hypothetical protein
VSGAKMEIAPVKRQEMITGETIRGAKIKIAPEIH